MNAQDFLIRPSTAGENAVVEHAGLKEYSCIGTVLCGSNMTRKRIKTWLLA